MNKFLAALVCAAILQVQPAFAEPSDKPYMGSEYYYKGILPYDECRIVSDGGFDITARGTIGALFGITTFYESDFYLSCWTQINDYVFSIPVHFDHIFHAGVMAELTRLDALTFKVAHLDNKTFSDLAGTYRGVSAGITALGGAKGGAMWHNGIRISYSSVQGLIGVSAGVYSSLKLGVYSGTLRLGKGEGPYRDISGLSEFRFQKIHKNRNNGRSEDEKMEMIPLSE